VTNRTIRSNFHVGHTTSGVSDGAILNITAFTDVYSALITAQDNVRPNIHVCFKNHVSNYYGRGVSVNIVL
jgi:hypothetical protein